MSSTRTKNVGPSATTATITSFDQSTHGGPDPIFDHFGIVPQLIVHGGCWGERVIGNSYDHYFGDPSNGMTLNQWAGYVLSLYAKWDYTKEIPILNIPIASSTASSGGFFTVTAGANGNGNTVPNLTTLLDVDDTLVMRYNATFTDTSFTDPNIANSYYPSGSTGTEVGAVAVVLTGQDAGDVQTIASVSSLTSPPTTGVTFNLAGAWKITPATGDLVIICAPSNPEIPSLPISAKNGTLSGVMAQIPALNLAGLSWLLRVRTEDVKGHYGPDAYAPFREVYMYGSQGTRTIGSGTTAQLLTDGMLLCDTSGGNVTVNLLAQADVPNMRLLVKKVTSDTNTVTINASGSDTIDGQTSVVLSHLNDLLEIKGNG